MDWGNMTNNEIIAELKSREVRYEQLKLETADGIDALLKKLYDFEKEYNKGNAELTKRLKPSL